MYFKHIKIDEQKLINNGFTKIESINNYLNLNSLSKDIIRETNGKNFLENSSANKNVDENLGVNKYLYPLLKQLSINYFDFAPDKSNQYHVTRVVYPGDKKEKYRAHFDSHLFTLVVPVQIPLNGFTKELGNDFSYGGRGELCYFANARKRPKNEIKNIIDKILFKRYASFEGLKKLVNQKKVRFESFENMEPILFIGNTTLHTNLSVSEKAEMPRISLLYHFFDTSSAFSIGNILRKIRRR